MVRRRQNGAAGPSFRFTPGRPFTGTQSPSPSGRPVSDRLGRSLCFRMSQNRTGRSGPRESAGHRRAAPGRTRVKSSCERPRRSGRQAVVSNTIPDNMAYFTTLAEGTSPAPLQTLPRSPRETLH